MAGRLSQIVSSYSRWSLGAEAHPAGPASATWVAANRAFFVPLYVPRPSVVKKLWWQNGAAVSGNVDCGIYRLDGTRIVSVGGKTQSGTGALQEHDITDIALTPGTYWMALVLDNAVGTIVRGSPSYSILRGAGVMQQTANAYPLPDTATLALLGNSGVLPVFGVALRTLVA